MKPQLIYKFMSGFYDLLDVVYFRKYATSPRRVVFEAIAPTDKVLDLCTGTGTNAVAIARKYPEAVVAGVDLSADMLTVARMKADKEQLHNIQLAQMDATKLTFDASIFDKVLLSLVLHEIDDQLAKKIIRESIRVLKPDGELIVTEWERSKEPLKKLLFFPIDILEPKPYKTFVRKDLVPYFAKYDLETIEQSHCDYSRVLRLRKKG